MPTRLTADTAMDTLHATGVKYIIGIDECGTGSLAGPLYCVAFMAPIDWNMNGLNDSKKLSARRRELLCEELFNEGRKGQMVQFATGIKHASDIDSMGLHPALKSAYLHALGLTQFEWNEDEKAECAIVLDGILTIPGAAHYTLPKADAIIPHVMASSILGKVARDSVMDRWHEKYPHYGWNTNKGYGTKAHIKALNEFGPCKEHRISYAPVRKAIEKL